MPDRILHKRSLTPGSIPLTSSLELGELAINVADGKIHIRSSGSSGDTIVSLVTANTVTTGSITATGGFTGSLQGSASYVEYVNVANKPTLLSSSAQIATDISGAFNASSSSLSSRITTVESSVSVLNAATSSYILASQTSSMRVLSASFATTASYALNGGVTQIVAGTNISISPVSGVGAVTINSTAAGGSGFPFSGSAVITGSLLISGSGLSVTGSVSTLGTVSTRGSAVTLASNLVSTTSTPQSYFSITGSIQQVQTASVQAYAVNIAPLLIYTTGSQSQTALRISPTFSGSAAFSSSQQNIIADFGATSVGTQFSVNDVTSGSIYMVNDVSGLPIIEALSDWTVNIYNYPTKVLQKTGNTITISGSLNVVTGSSTELLVTNTGVTIGNAVTDIHRVTGSLQVLGGITGSLLGTSSFATTASYVEYVNVANKPTLLSSSAQIATDISGAFTSISGGFSTRITTVESSIIALNAATSSYVLTSQTSSMQVLSASFATTASYALNGGVTQIIPGTNISISPVSGVGAVTINSTGGTGTAFPYTGSAIISGSLIVTGSISATGGYSGSFSGSFFGNGSGLTGITATADTTVVEAYTWFLI